MNPTHTHCVFHTIYPPRRWVRRREKSVHLRTRSLTLTHVSELAPKITREVARFGVANEPTRTHCVFHTIYPSKKVGVERGKGCPFKDPLAHFYIICKQASKRVEWALWPKASNPHPLAATVAPCNNNRAGSLHTPSGPTEECESRNPKFCLGRSCCSCTLNSVV